SLTLVGTKEWGWKVNGIISELGEAPCIFFRACKGIRDSASESLDDSGVIDVSVGLRDSLTAYFQGLKFFQY
ncbi:hypothetical protein Tco_1277822, partial [Tanacetum coccineum]